MEKRSVDCNRQIKAESGGVLKMRSKVKKRNEMAIEVIRAAALNFKSSFICRDKVEDFTGGAVRARNLANLDCLGQGPKGAFKVGRRQCYPVPALVEWLISRLEV